MPFASSGCNDPARLFGPLWGSDVEPHCDHRLFVGSIPCYYHNAGPWLDDEHSSALCPSDAQMALGQLEDLVLQAAEEIAELHGGALQSLLLLTSCPVSFSGVDFAYVVDSLAARGVACLRRESCRIMLADMGGSSYGSGRTALPSCYDQMLSFMKPKPPSSRAPSGGVLVVSDAHSFDQQNELRFLFGESPNAWMEFFGEEVSFERLEYLSSASTVLAVGSTDGAGTSVAFRIADKLGASLVQLPITYDLLEIEAIYDRLRACCGVAFDTSPFQRQAWEAIDKARAAWKGRVLHLSLCGMHRPWNMVKALLDYGFDIGGIEMMPPFNRARRGSLENDTDYVALVEAWPHVGDLVCFEVPRRPPIRDAGKGRSQGNAAVPSRMGRPLQSGSENFPTGGPLVGTKGIVAPCEAETWGYRAVVRCMELLCAEAERQEVESL